MSVLSLTDKAVLAKVKIQGRSGPVSSGISFDWSANTLEFQAVCEGSVSLNLKEKASDTTYYTVLVDGKEQARARSFRFPAASRGESAQRRPYLSGCPPNGELFRPGNPLLH